MSAGPQSFELLCYSSARQCLIVWLLASAWLVTELSQLVAEQPVTLHLKVSENRRFLQLEDGRPFFWLGDTGWLLFQKLSREESELYLENRRQKGFNVIQAVLIHNLAQTNYYGDMALIEMDPAQPMTTPGNTFSDQEAYDFWDHVDWVLDLAQNKGMYVALVPIWGGAAKKLMQYRNGDTSWASKYAAWLGHRFGWRPNVIWINGGDIRGDVLTDVWIEIGRTLKRMCPRQLITFHPFGRTSSSIWFHREAWLDFNMFQSGHARYDQIRETDDPASWKGEDNWKYVEEDYQLEPPKPTIDGEPSYEDIPQGLHDPTQPRWTDSDVRRYAYWSVFAGAFGHTYGHNSVMQFYKPNFGPGSYGVTKYWYEALDAPGALQLRHLKELMLLTSYFDRIRDQTLVAGENGQRYDYIIATRGEKYAFLYTYTGREFDVALGKIAGTKVLAQWFDPRTGRMTDIGLIDNFGVKHFDPPGEPKPGNDWVLVLRAVQ